MTDTEHQPAWREVLSPGQTCWRIEGAKRATVLFETSAYFEALRQVCEKAQKSILILGWDFDRRERLGRDDGAPTIEQFLCGLLEKRPHLNIHLLSWDYAFVYAAERE